MKEWINYADLFLKPSLIIFTNVMNNFEYNIYLKYCDFELYSSKNPERNKNKNKQLDCF